MSVWIYSPNGPSTSQASTTTFNHYVCSTEAERPVSGPMAPNYGDLAFTLDTQKWWTYKTAGWVEDSGGGGVPTSRRINTNAPLTGGGDLSADRTLDVTFGSAADTICEGNDSRLSDVRTPLAHKASHENGGSDELALDAAQVVSGQFAIARIASGTPDGTKFVRDDGTLATPAGGGGGPASCRKSGAAQTATTATLANITGLSFSLTSGVYYHFKFLVTFRSTVATVGLKLGLTFPSVTRFSGSARIPIAAAGAGGELQGPITASGGSVSGSAVPVVNTDYCAIVEGVILPSANGTLQLQFAAETTGATVTLQPESVGFLYTVA